MQSFLNSLAVLLRHKYHFVKISHKVTALHSHLKIASLHRSLIHLISHLQSNLCAFKYYVTNRILHFANQRTFITENSSFFDF